MLCVGKETPFYKCFQGDPARDECPCPKNGIEKKIIKCSIKETLLLFHVDSLGPFEVKMFISYFRIGIILYSITFSCGFALASLNVWYQCRSGSIPPSHVSCAADIKTGVKV